MPIAEAAVRRRRWVVVWITLVIVIGLVAVAARPVLHLARTAYRDEPTINPLPPEMVDDASRMNQVEMGETVTLATLAADRGAAERELIDLVDRANRDGLRISIAGARHTMGGHTIYPGGIALDMRGFNHMELDAPARILRVGAGAVWSEVIEHLDGHGLSVCVMQSNNIFTVGGSISANCHGWQHDRAPIASTVEAFTMVTADGAVLRCRS